MKYFIPVMALLALGACDSSPSLTNTRESGPQRPIPVNTVLTTRPVTLPIVRSALAATSVDGIELLQSRDFASNSGNKWKTCSGTVNIDNFQSEGVQAGVIKPQDCVQQLVDTSSLPAGTELALNCEARLSSASGEWTGVGLSFYDENWSFISEPNAALVGSDNFREYQVNARLPGGARYAQAWVYAESGADVRSCSLKRPDDDGGTVNFENVLSNPGFDNGSDSWIDYCGGTAVAGGVSTDSTITINGGACPTQSLDNTQLAALRGHDFQFQCKVENTGSGYSELVTNLGGNVSTQTIQSAEGIRLVTIVGSVPSDTGNAYVSVTRQQSASSLVIYECDLRRPESITNQPPIAKDDYRLFPAFDQSFSSRDLDVTANDFDPEGALDFRNLNITRFPANGSIFTTGVSVDYFTTTGLPDSFSYTIKDQQGLSSNEATVTIEFDTLAGNNPPVVLDDTFWVEPGRSKVLSVLNNDSDIDNDTLTDLTVTRGPAHGYTAVDTVTGLLTYNHSDDGSTEDSFAYSVSDGTVTRSATVTVYIRNDLSVLEGSPRDRRDVSSDSAYDFVQATLDSSPESGLRALWLMYNAVDHTSYRVGLYIDADKNPDTGFRGFNNEYAIGADYLVEGNFQYIYSGTGGRDWRWDLATIINPSVVSSSASVSIPLEDYFSDINGIDFFFRADNFAEGLEIDYYPDAASDISATPALRYFSIPYARVNGQPVADVYRVGDRGPAGGFVFSVSENGTRGLEVSPEESSAIWCDGTADALFTDIPNIENISADTNGNPIIPANYNSGSVISPKIVDVCGISHAAYLANGYLGLDRQTPGWYLPNIEELNLLFDNLDVASLGFGASSFPYWSSSENSSNTAWAKSFSNGALEKRSKLAPGSLLRIRAF